MADLFDSLLASLVLRTVVQYLIAFCGRLEAASDVTSGAFVGAIVLHKRLKLGGPRTYISREITPEAVRGGIFEVFHDNFRPEVDSDVISGADVDPIGMDVPEKFGASRSNSSRDIA